MQNHVSYNFAFASFMIIQNLVSHNFTHAFFMIMQNQVSYNFALAFFMLIQPTRVLNRVRNISNVRRILRTRQPCLTQEEDAQWNVPDQSGILLPCITLLDNTRLSRSDNPYVKQ